MEKIKPKIHIFGHIHEGYGVYRNEHTLFINASIFDKDKKDLNKPIYFDLENMERNSYQVI